MKTYYPTINLLRGIAAFLVCIFHFINYSDFRTNLFPDNNLITEIGNLGANGVFIFFVISGFVIPLSLLKQDFNLPKLPKFLFKRFIRIELPYIASIILILAVAWGFAFWYKWPFDFSIKQFAYHLVYYIPFSELPWYNVIYWTLAIEFQFYIVIGILNLIFSRNNQWLIVATLLVFALSNFLCKDNRFVFNYSVIFSQGIALLLMNAGKLKPTIAWIIIIASIISTAYLHSFQIAIFTGLTVLFIQFIELDKSWSNKFGEISYSLYLTHGLIGNNLIYFLGRRCESMPMKFLLVAAALITSMVFARIYWKLIESPSQKLSKKY